MNHSSKVDREVAGAARWGGQVVENCQQFVSHSFDLLWMSVHERFERPGEAELRGHANGPIRTAVTRTGFRLLAGHQDGKEGLLDQIVASWNSMAIWLRRLDGLRHMFQQSA